MLQVLELLVLEFPAWGLEASSEPTAAARARARTEEVELWDKKLIWVTNVPGRHAPPMPVQIQGSGMMRPATSRALHLSAFAAHFSKSRRKIQRLLLRSGQNGAKDTAKQSQHLLVMTAQALG